MIGGPDSSDELSLLQDIVEEVVNGRTEGHACPFCGGGPLEATVDEGGMRLECPSCGKYFEGRYR